MLHKKETSNDMFQACSEEWIWAHSAEKPQNKLITRFGAAGFNLQP